MKNKILKTFLYPFFLFTFCVSYADCIRPTVGFFNGILTDREEAQKNFNELINKLSEYNETFTQSGIPLEYVLFYNNTEGISKDLIEIFKQLKKEEENENKNENKKVLLNSRTDEDYKNHILYADAALKQGMGLLLVGHSQGNFFLNRVYNYCIANTNAVPCKAIHVASPSKNIYGSYVLSNNDLMIKSFDKFAGVKFEPNVKISYNLKDLSGHSFLKTYLNDKKPAERMIVESIGTALQDFCPVL